MAGEYLIPATNDIYKILNVARYPTQEELRKAATTGCITLDRLWVDAEFFVATDRLAERGRQNQEAVNAILRDVDELEHFLKAEMELLSKSGMDPGLIEYLWQRIWESIGNLNFPLLSTSGSAPGSLDQAPLPGSLSSLVHEFRNRCCEHADKLEMDYAYGQNVARNRNRTLNIVFGLGGLCMAGANGGLLAATIGFSGALSAVSLALGGGLVGAVVQTLLPQVAPPASG